MIRLGLAVVFVYSLTSGLAFKYYYENAISTHADTYLLLSVEQLVEIEVNDV